MKKILAKIKRDFMMANLPPMVTHWNEDKNKFTFFQVGEDPIELLKPWWLKIVEFLLYFRK